MPNLEQSNWEDEYAEFLNENPSLVEQRDYIRNLLKAELKQRDRENDQRLDTLVNTLIRDEERKIENVIKQRDEMWLSCLPEGEHITTAHTYRKRIFNNAKKLGLIK